MSCSTGLRTAPVDDASQATASVIFNTLTVFGIANILGNHKGFLNLELELLMDLITEWTRLGFKATEVADGNVFV